MAEAKKPKETHYVYGVNELVALEGYLEVLEDISDTFEGGIAIYGQKLGVFEEREKNLVYLGEVEE